MKRAFTLLELMIVVAIMGLMGTLSVGGYRAMRRGMEERSVMQNVNQFIRNAYQRAIIDRQPTAVYFWNETRRVESDDESLLVVGHVVAVRQAGRVSCVADVADGGKLLIDEFADLRLYKGTDEDGEDDENEETSQAQDGVSMYIYKIDGDKVLRCGVGQSTMQGSAQEISMMASNPSWVKANSDKAKQAAKSYGYYVKGDDGDDSITWKAGDAYCFEFADLTLPNNYIFGGNYSTTMTDPIQKLSTSLVFRPDKSPSGNVQISSLLPNSSGELSAQRIGDTSGAYENLSEQNE